MATFSQSELLDIEPTLFEVEVERFADAVAPRDPNEAVLLVVERVPIDRRGLAALLAGAPVHRVTIVLLFEIEHEDVLRFGEHDFGHPKGALTPEERAVPEAATLRDVKKQMRRARLKVRAAAVEVELVAAGHRIA